MAIDEPRHRVVRPILILGVLLIAFLVAEQPDVEYLVGVFAEVRFLEFLDGPLDRVLRPAADFFRLLIADHHERLGHDDREIAVGQLFLECPDSRSSGYPPLIITNVVDA